jgi:hypothetical protein
MLLHEVYVTKIDALYHLHATLGHMTYSRIERMILKGLWNGYCFDMALLKQLVNIKCDICMRAKITDGKHTGKLCRSAIPCRMLAIDITGSLMPASIHESKYQFIMNNTFSKHV